MSLDILKCIGSVSLNQSLLLFGLILIQSTVDKIEDLFLLDMNWEKKLLLSERSSALGFGGK